MPLKDTHTGPRGIRARRACDLCNTRRTKCRLPEQGLPSSSRDDDPVVCLACQLAGLHCSWTRESARRGPKRKSPSKSSKSGDVPIPQIDTEPYVDHPSHGSCGPSPRLAGIHDPPAQPVDVSYAAYGPVPAYEPGPPEPPHVEVSPIHSVGSSAAVDSGLVSAEPYSYYPDGPTFADALASGSTSALVSDFDRYEPQHDAEPAVRSPPCRVYKVRFAPETGASKLEPVLDALGAPLYESLVSSALRNRMLGPLQAGGSRSAPLWELPEPDATLRGWLTYWLRHMWAGDVTIDGAELLAVFDAGHHHRAYHFRALVLALVAAATTHVHLAKSANMISAEQSPSSRPPGMHDVYLAMATQCVACLPSSVGDITLSDITACLILQNVWRFVEGQQPGTSWSLMQQAITKGELLGLHDWHARALARRSTPVSALRLRIFYWLNVRERNWTFYDLGPSAFPRSCRLPGRMWEDTAWARAQLDPAELSLFPLYFVRAMSTVDERVIACWSSNCLRGGRDCPLWTEASAIELSRRAAREFDEGISGMSTVYDLREGGRAGETSSVVMMSSAVCHAVSRMLSHHGLVTPDQSEPTLRPEYRLSNMRQMLKFWQQRVCVIEDPALDWCYKLYHIVKWMVDDFCLNGFNVTTEQRIEADGLVSDAIGIMANQERFRQLAMDTLSRWRDGRKFSP